MCLCVYVCVRAEAVEHLILRVFLRCDGWRGAVRSRHREVDAAKGVFGSVHRRRDTTPDGFPLEQQDPVVERSKHA